MLVQISSVYLIADNTTIPIFADVPKKMHKCIIESHLKRMVVLLKKVNAAKELQALTKTKTAEHIASAGGTNANRI